MKKLYAFFTILQQHKSVFQGERCLCALVRSDMLFVTQECGIFLLP